MHFAYVIYSPGLDVYYVGETDNIQTRTAQHNAGFFEGSFTVRATDWKLKRKMELCSRSDARRVEAYIKSMKSKKFLAKLCTDNEFYENFRNLVYSKMNIEIK